MIIELLAAHAAGSVEVAIGRASDFFGPGTTHSALGELVFGAALRGKTAQIMGNLDRLHSYSYTPDVAAGLIVLGADPRAAGHVWHLPIAETWTTREIVGQVYRLAGSRPRLFAAGSTTLRLYGLINPAMRDYLHTLYQFTDDWRVSDAKFRTTFGDISTPLTDALAATLEWYRLESGAPAGASASNAICRVTAMVGGAAGRGGPGRGARGAGRGAAGPRGQRRRRRRRLSGR